MSVLVSALMLICLLLGAYGAGQLMLSSWSRGDIGRIVISTFLGLVLLTFLYVALLSMEYANRASLTVLVLAFAANAFRQRLKISLKRSIGATSLAGACVLMPTVLQGVMMAGGEYPAVFFNVDTAYYLQFVHSILEHEQYPPPRLDNYGVETRGYHYAVMALAALLTTITGIMPHTAFLLIVPVVGLCALIAAVNELLKLAAIDRPWVSGAILFIVLTGYFEIGYPSIVCDSTVFSFNGLVCLASQSPDYTELAAHPPHTMHFGTLYGFSICIIIMVLALQDAHKSGRAGYIAAISLVPLVKTPYMPFVAMGIGGYSLARFARSRELDDLLVPIFAGIGMIACFVLFGAVASTPEGGSWELKFRGTIKSSAFFTTIFHAAGAAALVTFANMWRRTPVLWSRMLWFVAPLFLFGVSVSLDNRNADQTMALVPFLAHALLLFVSAAALKDSRTWSGRLAGGTVLGLLLVASFYSWAEYTRVLVVQPENGYEFVDNRPLAEVLAKVPLENSMLVTNDLRYPANNYARPRRQFQLTALYGHKAFNAEGVYTKNRQKSTEASLQLWEEKRRLQDLLTRNTWSGKEINEIISRYPVTHLVIHRSFPHPDRIPLELVAENSRYAVYAFH